MKKHPVRAHKKRDGTKVKKHSKGKSKKYVVHFKVREYDVDEDRKFEISTSKPIESVIHNKFKDMFGPKTIFEEGRTLYDNKYSHPQYQSIIHRIRLEEVKKKGKPKNPYAKTVKPEDAYEVWQTPDGSWTWYVLKKYQIDDDKPYARWFCQVKSPFTPHGELGDVYVAEIKQNAIKIK